MTGLSRESSLSFFGVEDNQIERIAGLHLDGDQYSSLKWDIHFFSSQEINPIIMKIFLEGRCGHNGYGLSLLGHVKYQLWPPCSLIEVGLPSATSKYQLLTSCQKDIESCKKAPRDLDNMYRAISFGAVRQNLH